MRRFVLTFAAAATVAAGSLVAGLGSTAAVAAPTETAPKHVFPARGVAQPQGQGKPSKGGGGGGGSTNNGIYYHGGPLILKHVDAYYIWYGDWSGSTAAPTSNVKAQTILNTLAGGIGGSSYFNINTTYYDGSNTHVTNAVTLAGSTAVGYSHGTALSDADVQSVVTDAIGTGALPPDPNGVYFVLTSADVSETSGFLTQYCGWHTYTSSNGGLQYAFVGDPAADYAACSAQSTTPNGSESADAMASVIAHELEEATTDPQLNAWYDRRGYENADKCAWKFGSTYTTANGAQANMSLGGLDYLIQQNWVNAKGGYCALSY